MSTPPAAFAVVGLGHHTASAALFGTAFAPGAQTITVLLSLYGCGATVAFPARLTVSNVSSFASGRNVLFSSSTSTPWRSCTALKSPVELCEVPNKLLAIWLAPVGVATVLSAKLWANACGPRITLRWRLTRSVRSPSLIVAVVGSGTLGVSNRLLFSDTFFAFSSVETHDPKQLRKLL